MNDKLPDIHELFNIAEDKTWLSYDKVFERTSQTKYDR